METKLTCHFGLDCRNNRISPQMTSAQPFAKQICLSENKRAGLLSTPPTKCQFAIMNLPNRTCKPLLLFMAAVGSLWLITGNNLSRDSWNPPLLLFDLLNYVDTDRGMASECNCASIWQGDTEEIEKAKLMMLHKELRRSVRISDEDYVNATQDCEYVE